MSGATLILGVGNVLLHDEAIGVWVAEWLKRKFDFPQDVTIVEGGTLGLDLLPCLVGVERLLLVDAVKLGKRPGEIVRLEGDEIPRALALKVSPHQVGVADLLASARLSGYEPSSVVLWGMEPKWLEPGLGFSQTVARALPSLVDEVLGELRRWKLVARPRRSDAPTPLWWTTPKPARV